MRPRLRLFTGEDDELNVDASSITITLGELLEVIRDATESERTWLEDFRNDEVQIPEDLYDVMSEYKALRPGA